jgi:penicillin amidase
MKPFKLIKKVLIAVVVLLMLSVAVVYIWLKSLMPNYDERIKISGIKSNVEVYYDRYQIPHIYANSAEDAWLALGYVHAQDRLFQMELLRRVGSGRLSEIFGKDLIEVDKLFRTLGINQVAEASAKKYFSGSDSAFQKLTHAYLNGINLYLDRGKTPVEFTLLGIPKTHFTVTDVYLISGYMGFSFAEALRNDPVLSFVANHYGLNYFNTLMHACNVNTAQCRIPVTNNKDMAAYQVMMSQLKQLEDKLPVKIWTGSNSWVLSPQRTASGKVLFANDTHIGHAAPCVWYEAHIECPEVSLYGNYLAGFPFPLIGHTRSHAWGMTMLENDDFNFYREKLNPANPQQYWHQQQWKNFNERHETIKVKDEQEVPYTVLSSVHGPIIYGSSATKHLPVNFDTAIATPVAAWWVYQLHEAKTIQAGYRLMMASDLAAMEEAASMIDAPGINLMYGDSAGNIAWWATGKLFKLPQGVDSKLILDGANGIDDSIAWLPFSNNPKCINPASGFVYSANNQPDTVNGFLLPGYYTPPDRALRINRLLNTKQKFSMNDMKHMFVDDYSGEKQKWCTMICERINDRALDPYQREVYQTLKNWNGTHHTTETGPVIFYSYLSILMKNMMKDELGEKYFNEFVNSHTMKNAYYTLCENSESPWWDNISTKDKRETSTEIIMTSFVECCKMLQAKLGSNLKSYTWGKVHQLELVHPIGRQKPFDFVFNIGPMPISGGNETINNMGFKLDVSGNFAVTLGPAMRIAIDFADVEEAVSVLPSGQSGYFFSKHYYDQFDRYVAGEFRKMLMNEIEIKKESKHQLVFMPLN